MSRRRPPRVPGLTRGRALFVLPAIPDDADEETKNGLALRNACATEGRCPGCGARGELTGPDELGFHHLTFRHEHWCRTVTDEAVA